MNLEKLKDFFPANDIEFRVGSTNKEKTKGLALAYVTNRAIQKRLDEVCGVENWKNDFKEWRGNSQLCGISIRVDGEWITKWDGADDTATEPIKGGLSDSMKRAAVQWGIGRYLYEIPDKWYPIVQSGKSYKFEIAPSLPATFLPQGDKAKSEAPTLTDEEKKLKDMLPPRLITDKELKKIKEWEQKYNLKLSKTLDFFGLKKIEDMTLDQFKTFMKILQDNYKDARFEYSTAEEIEEKTDKQRADLIEKLDELIFSKGIDKAAFYKEQGITARTSLKKIEEAINTAGLM